MSLLYGLDCVMERKKNVGIWWHSVIAIIRVASHRFWAEKVQR